MPLILTSGMLRTPRPIKAGVIKNSRDRVLYMKYLLIILMILFQNTAYSAKSRAVESYENWVSSPSQESLGKLVSQIKRLNREDVLALIRSGNLLSFSGIVYLPTILSKYEKFDSIYEHCIKDYGDLEKAICISAMME